MLQINEYHRHSASAHVFLSLCIFFLDLLNCNSSIEVKTFHCSIENVCLDTLVSCFFLSFYNEEQRSDYIISML